MAEGVIQKEFRFFSEIKKEVEESRLFKPLWKQRFMEGVGPKMIRAFREINAKASADPNNHSKRSADFMLIKGVKNREKESITRALSEGAGPNAKDRYGNATLVEAIRDGSEELFEMLIEKGADVNARCKGVNALFFTREAGSGLFVKDFSWRIKRGITKNKEVSEELRDHGHSLGLGSSGKVWKWLREVLKEGEKQ